MNTQILPNRRSTLLRLSLSALLSLLISLPALSAKWSDYGNYNISWFDKNKSEFFISTPAELAGVAYLVNAGFTTFEGKTIYLTSDIDLRANEWVPIGTFQGVFNGNNHTIDYEIKNAVSNCGFWKKLKNAKVCNFCLSGDIYTSKDGVGLVAAEAENTSFDNLKLYPSIKYSNLKGFSSSDYKFKNCIGGCVAFSKNCKYTNLQVIPNFGYYFGNSNGTSLLGSQTVYLAGIVADSNSDVIYKCYSQNIFDLEINGYITTNAQISMGCSAYCCGIVGVSSLGKTEIASCYSCTQRFEGINKTGTFDKVGFNYDGIGRTYSGTIKNSVAQILRYTVQGHDYTWQAAYYHTNCYFSGITYGNPSIMSNCYSNPITDLQVYNVNKVDLNNQGKHGNTNFTRKQMNSQEFVDELNLYSQMEFGTKNWELRGSSLSILFDNQSSGINEINDDASSPADKRVFDITGVQRSGTEKGINIVRYPNGKTVKVLCK